VVVDVDFLQTLELRRVRDGMAEVVKHAIAQDADFVETLLDYVGDLRDPDFLDSVVRRNIALKCALMATDPQERREGMVLQYGHAIGHAVEYQSGFELLHGEAVAVGMMAAARVARRMGLASDAVVQAHRRLITHFGLPAQLPAELSTPTVLRALRYDKRASVADGARLALVGAVGALAVQPDGEAAWPVPAEIIGAALDDIRAESLRASA
jgi:3-dehydroquinate synthase